MMEEASDEQPEMVSHEEAVLAEKEANLLASSASGSVQPMSGLAAPSPLPAFLSTSTTVASSPQASVSSRTVPDPVSAPVSPESTAQKAPVPPHIPHDGIRSSTTPETPESSASTLYGAAPGRLFDWISSNSLVNRVVEKTKSSMESVITTLDPGMMNVMHSGGEISVVVTSTKDNKVLPVREAFQKVFGRATVTGQASEGTTAVQPIGFAAGLKGAEDRIENLRKSGSILDSQIVVSVEGFILEILPERWYEMSCLVLKDTVHGIEFQTFSQPTLIPTEYVLTAQDKTPSDYPLRWAGLAVSIGEVIETAQPHIGRADWQKVLSGVSRHDSILLAALSLANMYKNQLPTSFIS